MICGTEARVEDSPDAAPARLLTLPLPTSVVEAIKVSLSKKLFHQSDMYRVGCCCVTISQVFPLCLHGDAGVLFNYDRYSAHKMSSLGLKTSQEE